MLVSFWLAIRDPLADIVTSKVPKSIVITIPSLLLLSLILALSYIFYLRKKLKVKLFIAFGVYWDNDLNPYCSSCQKLLSNYAYYGRSVNFKGHPGFKCFNCDKTVHLSDEKNIFITIEGAKDKLLLLRKTTSANKAKTVK